MKNKIIISLSIITLIIAILIGVLVIKTENIKLSFSDGIVEIENENNQISNDISSDLIENENEVVESVDNTIEEQHEEEITISKTQESKQEKTNEVVTSKEEPKVQVQPQVQVKVSQPKEEPKAVETKTETIQETTPSLPKCTETSHGVGVGNSNKWFNSQQDAIAYYDNLTKMWGDKWESFEIDSATYDKNCPYGYEVWSCPFCGKWTINFYYR